MFVLGINTFMNLMLGFFALFDISFSKTSKKNGDVDGNLVLGCFFFFVKLEIKPPYGGAFWRYSAVRLSQELRHIQLGDWRSRPKSFALGFYL